MDMGHVNTDGMAVFTIFFCRAERNIQGIGQERDKSPCNLSIAGQKVWAPLLAVWAVTFA